MLFLQSYADSVIEDIHIINTKKVTNMPYYSLMSSLIAVHHYLIITARSLKKMPSGHEHDGGIKIL